MRSLSATLEAAQQAMELDALVKITLSKSGESDVVLERDRILQVPAGIEHPDSQTVEVVLDNSDGYFTSKDLKGWDAVVQRGLVTSAGEEYSALPPFKVVDMRTSSDPSGLLCFLSLIGIPDRLAEDKAEMNAPYSDYHHHWSSTKTVKDLFTEIADGQPVSEELTEEQAESDGYIDLDDTLHGAGQRLTISRTVTKLAFRLKKTGTPAGTNVTFKIVQVEAPQATLASKTFPIASISTSPAWCEATLDSPVAVDEEVWIYVEYTDGTATDYVSVSYNSTAVKPDEWLVKIDPVDGPVSYTDQDCAYRYKYTYAGIDCFDHCEAYEVVYDSEDSLIDSYCPADGFVIHEGDARLDVLNRLLQFTGCVKRAEDDGKLHVFVPTTSGVVYDAEYSLVEGEHQFCNKANRDALVRPNRILVHSYPDDEDQYSGEATSAESYGLLPITGTPIKAKLTSNAQATSMAEAKITMLEIDSQRGSASVPINLGAEVYDYIKVTDSRQGDSRTGNHLYLKWTYTSGRIGAGQAQNDWLMQFSFGKFSPVRIEGTKLSLLKEVLPEGQYDPDAVVRWGPLLDHLRVHADAIDDIQDVLWGRKGSADEPPISGVLNAIKQILLLLGAIDDETPISEQLAGYLQNVVEDLSPQLGGNLDVNGHSIRDTVNGVPIVAGNQSVPITAGGSLHSFNTDGDLDMYNNKVVQVATPSVDDDAATKGYVDGAVEHLNWLATPVQILADTNRTSTLSWTDLDVTAQTSASTFAVILQLQIQVDAMGAGSADNFELGVRKNGDSPTYYPRLRVSDWIAGATAPRRVYTQVIVGVDSLERLEYQLTVNDFSGTAQADFYINLLGYYDLG